MTCTFFFFFNAPQNIQPVLFSVLVDLIENKNAHKFYVGNNGNFDRIVADNLKMLRSIYPHIEYFVVLSYMPFPKDDISDNTFPNTIYPEGLEHIPLRFAIYHRNIWMINKSDYVVTYVKHLTGGAAKFKKIAEQKGKTVLNIADIF